MERIFLLAERIVHQLKHSFLNVSTINGNLYFKESIITDSTFKITFTDNKTNITLFLSLHHLDIPWKIEIVLIENSERLNFNNKMMIQKGKNNIYDVYPNLLKDPKGLGNELAKEIARDLLNYLAKID